MNLFLTKHGVDYQEILDNEGKVKITVKKKSKSEDWWNIYTFSNDEEYQSWKTECLKIIKTQFKLSDEETLREFDIFDIWHGPPQPYLFKEQATLF